MKINGAEPSVLHWWSLIGETVEVWLEGKLYRRGVVDEAMPNGSGLWLAREGIEAREFISRSSGFEARSALAPGPSD